MSEQDTKLPDLIYVVVREDHLPALQRKGPDEGELEVFTDPDLAWERAIRSDAVVFAGRLRRLGDWHYGSIARALGQDSASTIEDEEDETPSDTIQEFESSVEAQIQNYQKRMEDLEGGRRYLEVEEGVIHEDLGFCQDALRQMLEKFRARQKIPTEDYDDGYWQGQNEGRRIVLSEVLDFLEVEGLSSSLINRVRKRFEQKTR